MSLNDDVFVFLFLSAHVFSGVFAEFAVLAS